MSDFKDCWCMACDEIRKALGADRADNHQEGGGMNKLTNEELIREFGYGLLNPLIHY